MSFISYKTLMKASLRQKVDCLFPVMDISKKRKSTHIQRHIYEIYLTVVNYRKKLCLKIQKIQRFLNLIGVTRCLMINEGLLMGLEGQ